MINMLLVLIFGLSITKLVDGTEPTESKYWQDLSRQSLYHSRKLVLNGGHQVKKAKNVILFIGDGMGLPTIAAARLLKRQLTEDHTRNLFFEQFDYTALIKTYNLDFAVPDSAATGTAFCCGVKGNLGTIGVNGNVYPGETNSNFIEQNIVKSVFKKAALHGKSVGIVTTASVTDATPAAAYAHVSFRGYENQVFEDNEDKFKDIARQLIEDNDFNVVLGGGKANFIPTKYEYINHMGRAFIKTIGNRMDNYDLIQFWKLKKYSRLFKEEYRMVEEREDLLALDYDKIKYLLGLFSEYSMKFDKERTKDDKEPSLKEMTEAAIKVLKKNKNGFFLMVEGGLIDKAHHGNLAYYSLHDVLAFDKAIKAAYDLVNPNETLIIVTADHSHSFNFNSDQPKEYDIFGFNNELDNYELRFTQLIYSTGPGHKPRTENETLKKIGKPDYQQISAIKLKSALHGGDDVAAYATGPGANLLRGSQEQTVIAHLMEFSACIGDYVNEDHCKKNKSKFTATPIANTGKIHRSKMVTTIYSLGFPFFMIIFKHLFLITWLLANNLTDIPFWKNR